MGSDTFARWERGRGKGEGKGGKSQKPMENTLIFTRRCTVPLQIAVDNTQGYKRGKGGRGKLETRRTFVTNTSGLRQIIFLKVMNRIGIIFFDISKVNFSTFILGARAR